MNIDWGTVVSSLIASGVVGLGSAKWLGQRWIDHRLQRAVEEQKAQLKAQADAELERMKAQHAMMIAERNLIFSKLHEKRFEAIHELHVKISKTVQQINRFISAVRASDAPTKDRISGDLNNAMKILNECVLNNRIFLPKDMCDLVFKNCRTLESISRGLKEFDRGFESHQMIESGESLMALSHQMTEASALLEAEFRKALGDT